MRWKNLERNREETVEEMIEKGKERHSSLSARAKRSFKLQLRGSQKLILMQGLRRRAFNSPTDIIAR